MRPFAALVGGLAYVFSPYVVAGAAPNPVFLAALAVLPTLPAIVLAAAKGRIRLRLAAVLFALTAPMLGYVFMNPPLLGMVLLAGLCTPLIAAGLWGGAAGRRGLVALVAGMALLTACSAFWLVPAVLLVLSGVSNELAALSSWTWMESRATLWKCSLAQQFLGLGISGNIPFAGIYDTYPLALLKFGPAALAFAALAFRHGVESSQRVREHLRIAVVAAAVALVLIFISTGTKPPGNVIFDRLYRLPLGWLLREPGRFLMLADLCYAALIAVTVERVANNILDRLKQNGRLVDKDPSESGRCASSSSLSVGTHTRNPTFDGGGCPR